MLIETTGSFGLSAPQTALVVGGVRHPLGQIPSEDLREDILAFAAGLARGLPFVAEFGCEPLFNVEFKDDTFVAYTWRPRVRGALFGWLGSMKVESNSEKLAPALAYLKDYAAQLKSV